MNNLQIGDRIATPNGRVGPTDLPSDAVVGKSKLLELITRVAEVERKQDRLQKMVMDV